MSLLADLDIGLVWEHVHNGVVWEYVHNGVVHNGGGGGGVVWEHVHNGVVWEHVHNGVVWEHVHNGIVLAVYAKDQLHDVFEEGNDVACVGNDQFEVGW